MNLVGAIQTLGDYSLRAAGDEDLAVYDSIAEIAAQLAGVATLDPAAQSDLLAIASKASEISEAIRVNEQRQLAFQQFLKPGDQAI